MSASAAYTTQLAKSGASLRAFLGWWGQGLSCWLPAGLRRVVAAGQTQLLLQLGDTLRIRLRQDTTSRELAELPLPLPAANGSDPLAALLRGQAAELSRWLVLPADAGLRRSLMLPAAAKERLRDVLGFEVERQTPFAPADVLYAGRVLAQREDGQLQVELVVVPRRRYEAELVRVGGLASQLSGVDMVDADGRLLGVNLLPPAQRQVRRNPWRWWNLGLAVATVVLVVLGSGQLLDNRRHAADALQAGMATRAAEARQVSAQKQQLLDAVEGGAWLQAQRNARPPVVEVMQALAQRIPDGAWLEKLSIDDRQLTLIGLSQQAAGLVGKLEGAPQWRAPALSGALQKDPRSQMDRFTLVAQLATSSPAATPAKESPDAAH